MGKSSLSKIPQSDDPAGDSAGGRVSFKMLFGSVFVLLQDLQSMVCNFKKTRKGLYPSFLVIVKLPISLLNLFIDF